METGTVLVGEVEDVGSRRTKLFSDKSQNVMAAALAPSVGDGVCASMIEPQDYICGEHTVYWEWTWDELVTYDLPATFQYVHDQAGQNLHHGTLIAQTAFSKSQLVNSLRSAALLYPIAYVGQMSSPIARNAAKDFLAEII
ncbi:triacylglycerol lipase 2-like [Populus alba x Populus x berolinensis]|nr:triacylglycerol lipase 2-like [Populus alba x Populus x berolinensis]